MGPGNGSVGAAQERAEPHYSSLSGSGLLGALVIWKVDRGAFFLLGGLALTVTLGLVFYLNFKYGYSLAPEIQARELHEVRERDYFFIVSFGLWGVLAGLGLTAALAAGFRIPLRGQEAVCWLPRCSWWHSSPWYSTGSGPAGPGTMPPGIGPTISS